MRSGPREGPPAVLRVGRRIVRCLVDPGVRDAVEGDLEELYRLRLAARGRWSATLRYALDVISLVRARAAVRRAAAVDPDSGRPREWTMDLLRDLRQAVRALIENPAYSAVVLLTLALAIGANTAIFGVVDGVLLKPLPYEDPNEIVTLRERGFVPRGEDAPSVVSQRLFTTWRERGRSFAEMAMYSHQTSSLTDGSETDRLIGAAVSPSLFSLLGVSAHLGRTLVPDEEHAGADPVIVLSHRAWQRYFGGAPDLVGTSVRLDDDTVRTVVGIMPPSFAFPDASTDYWVPLIVTPREDPAEDPVAGVIREEVRSQTGTDDGGGPGSSGGRRTRMETFVQAVARLADGVSAEMAAEEGARLAAGLYAGSRMRGGNLEVDVTSLEEQLVGPVRRPILMLMGAVAFVLLIACANVANLVMARAAQRRQETAVRAALGAGWWKLGRPLIAESAVLAAAGALVGLALAVLGLRVLSTLAPEFIPRLDQVAVDGRAILFTAGITALTTLLFSLAPLRGAARIDLTATLKENSESAPIATGRHLGRRLLVLAEISASVVLLVGAGLLIGSFLRLSSVDHGFNPDNLLNVELRLPPAAYPDAATHLETYDRIVRRLEGLSVVSSATVAARLPSSPANMRVGMRVEGGAAQADEEPTTVGVRVVENDYFETVGAELVRGRFFDREDRPETLPVMVLSESGARALFGEGTDPIGRRLDFMGNEGEVVGIVADVRTAGVDPTPQPDIFFPYRQAREQMIPRLFRVANLLVRSQGPPLEALPAVRDLLRQEVPGSDVLGAVVVRDLLADAVAEPRFYASLVGAFALLAFVLAAVGIYGLLAYTVQQGVRETAIRRALGAPAGDILRGVLTDGLGLTTVGLAIGVGGALVLSRLLEAMLYEVRPRDPMTIVAVAGLYLAVALMAILVPARRAMRVDPMEALRE